jgi:PTS system ascorbate-specific IIA component
LVTHDGLGNSLMACARHVLGNLPAELLVISVLEHDDPEQKAEEGRAAVTQLDQGAGVLILADIFGATPSNIGRVLCELHNVQGVAGVNLPMLLRAICNINKPLTELVQLCVEGGRNCIVPIELESQGICNAATRCAD